MTQRITVHDPRGYPPKVVGKRLAPRLSALDGKTVYLVDCLFDNSAVFMEQLQQWFGEHLPAVDARIIRPKETWADDPEMRASQPSLTFRELEVLELLATGMRNKEIAAKLGISEDTTRAHIKSIFVKFNVHDRTAALAEALRRGIVRIH